MTTFIGFSTQHVENTRPSQAQRGTEGGASPSNQITRYGKKFRTTDEQLVIQDFINALNIPQGQKVGNPGYGTTLWDFIFEPNTLDTRIRVEDEIRRVASLDPRLNLNSVVTYDKDNGILLELELAITPFNNAQTLSIMFDQNAGSAFGV
jgi:phage baseplate assembly protein W